MRLRKATRELRTLSKQHNAATAQRLIVHGVDFSGADSGGSAKIRIAERELVSRSAVTIRGRVDRHGLRAAILDSLQDGREHLWRIDAPFGLPLECFANERPSGMHEGELSWRVVADWVATFDSAREWRSAMRELSRREPRRACDRVLHTPLAPMNLRVFKQTFTVIKDILVPLADAGVAIMPVWMPATNAKSGAPLVRVCESGPASILHNRAWPAKGYKGTGEPPRARREEIVRLLAAALF